MGVPNPHPIPNLLFDLDSSDFKLNCESTIGFTSSLSGLPQPKLLLYHYIRISKSRIEMGVLNSDARRPKLSENPPGAVYYIVNPLLA